MRLWGLRLHSHVSDCAQQCSVARVLRRIRKVFGDRQNAGLAVELDFVSRISCCLNLAGLCSNPRDDIANGAALELRDHQRAVRRIFPKPQLIDRPAEYFFPGVPVPTLECGVYIDEPSICHLCDGERDRARTKDLLEPVLRLHQRRLRSSKIFYPLSYNGNLLVENRNGLIVNTEVFEANGTAERDAALVMLEQIPGTRQVTVGGDKAYDTADFVAECRNLKVTPHVAQNLERPGGSAIDARTTQHAGYAISQRKRKRVEECFGWLKTIALLRKVRHRGVFKVGWVFTFAAAAYNLVRLRNLAIQAT